MLHFHTVPWSFSYRGCEIGLSGEILEVNSFYFLFSVVFVGFWDGITTVLYVLLFSLSLLINGNPDPLITGDPVPCIEDHKIVNSHN